MKNAFSRTGRTCAFLLTGALLLGGALFAGTVNPITVTLPHDVSAGSVTLPAGQYVITGFELGSEELFVVRGEHAPAITLRGVRSVEESDKTEVTLVKDGETWHFDKLNIAGEGESFRFLNSK